MIDASGNAASDRPHVGEIRFTPARSGGCRRRQRWRSRRAPTEVNRRKKSDGARGAASAVRAEDEDLARLTAASLAGTLSTRITWWPRSAKYALGTSPTYPEPTTATCIPTLRNKANGPASWTNPVYTRRLWLE